MSPSSTGPSDKSTEQRHSVRFSNSALKPTSGKILISVNLYITQVSGIPTSWLKQYRITVKCGADKSSTSWKAAGDAVFPVNESAVFRLIDQFAMLTVTVECRNILGIPTVIGRTESLSISELQTKQSPHPKRPFSLDLSPVGESQLMHLYLTFRIFNSARAEDDQLSQGNSRTHSIAQATFESYPEMVGKALKAWEQFSPTVSDPCKNTSYRFLSQMLYQTGEYIKAHSRQRLTYALEDDVWEFLRETAKAIKRYQPAPKGSFQVDEEFYHRATLAFRGFWLLLQLHCPPDSQADFDQQQKSLQSELKLLASFYTQANSSFVKPPSMATDYPQLLKLKDSGAPTPKPHSPGIESLFHSITFMQIARWMVNPEVKQQVFWLHGKFEAGTAGSQLGAALLEASKLIKFPAAYCSLSKGSNKAVQNIVRDALGSMIYQLSLFDDSLAGSFHAMITKSSMTFSSLDFFARFQLLLQTLRSLSFEDIAKRYPMLLIIDELEPSDDGGVPSPEYNEILQILHAASITTPASSPSSDTRFPLDSFSPSSNFAIPNPHHYRDSLSFPKFLRIVVLSRSLGNSPSIIEEFALIENEHRLSGGTWSSSDKASELYIVMKGRSSKGKAGRERIPLDYGPLGTIAEANSEQSGGN